MQGGRRGETQLRHAVTVLEPSGAQLEHARALIDLGGMLRRDNRPAEIAQALFVTVKAVEVHLSSVYRKLQIKSRTQLADVISGLL